MAMIVTLYSQPTCTASAAERDYLSGRGVRFVERNVIADRKARLRLNRLRIAQTPVTEVGDSLMVGFDPVELDRLLSVRA
jgi:glutaredoxin